VQDLDAKLNDVLSLFRYLSDKDVFEEYYKQHLALRLLEFANQGGLGSGIGGGAAAGAGGTGEAAKELEKIMIAKLKAECGHQVRHTGYTAAVGSLCVRMV
jgi:cullin 3